MEKTIIKAKAGQKVDDFVRNNIMEGNIGTFQFNDFIFELKGNEELKDYYMIMAQYYLFMTRQ